VELITTQQLLGHVSERWKNTYEKNGDWGQVWLNGRKTRGSAKEIYNELLLCKTIEEVEKVIGNNSWTALRCDSCGALVEELVKFCGHSDEPYSVCKDCLTKALGMLEK